MEDEKKENVIEDEKGAEQGDSKYIEAITELKKNTVSKEKYAELEEENAKLLSALIDGGQVQVESGAANQKDVDKIIDSLRQELYGEEDSDLSDLEIASKTLELRNAIIERDGEDADPFLPNGIAPTAYDKEKAALVAQELQDAVDRAEGSNEVFRGLFVSKIKDDPKSKTIRK